MSYRDMWLEKALLREGERLTVYVDTEGYPTVGIGHKVLPEEGLKVGDRITKARSRELFWQDTKTAEIAALRQAKEVGIKNDGFICALISVNFQLGTNWTKKFKTTWPAIVRGDFDTAISNLRRSKWYRQTPVRVEDFIRSLERAKMEYDRPLPKTRTMQGAGVAGVGLVASETVTEVADKIEPLAPYSDHLQYVFLVLALLGIALTIYARVDDRKKGYR